MSITRPHHALRRRATTASAAALPLTLALALAACSSGPPTPDWQMNAQSSVQRFETAYMEGNGPVEETEFKRAREQVARTGQIDLIARMELIRCATRVASLVFEECAGFERLRQDAAPADRAYADYLAGKLADADVALLPEAQRAVGAALAGVAAGHAANAAAPASTASTASIQADSAATAAVQAIADPLSKLVAAGVLLRANRATPALLAAAADAASGQGWRRPLLAWLGAQALRAEQAGDAAEGQRIRRRMALVASGGA